MPRRSKRDEILQAATACFYERGITASGVDLIAERAGVSKRTLYNHFPSKDDLVAAYVGWQDARWRTRLESALETVQDPAARVLAYAQAYLATPEDDFRGCALINAAAEITPDDDPVLQVIAASKDDVQRDLEHLLLAACHPTPQQTAVAISMLLEGAYALGGIHRSRDDLSTVLGAIRRLCADTQHPDA